MYCTYCNGQVFTEPTSWVSLKHPNQDYEDEDDYYDLNNGLTDMMPDLPRSGLSHRILLFVLVTIFSIILITVVLFCMALLYRKQKKKYLYSNGRSVMTFSNPNYYTSNNENGPQTVSTNNDKRPFIWKRLKYDKSQVSFLNIIKFPFESS